VSESSLHVGIVGMGLIGARRAQFVREDGAAELVGVADADLERSASASREFGCGVYGGWQDLVAAPGVDALIVATSNDMLATITMAALDAGKHVLCEKPAGRSVEEARQMFDTAERAGRTLAFGFNHRHTAGVLKAREIVDAGGIGSLLWIRARYGHGARPGFEKEWRADPARAGGGELLDQGVHLIDLAQALLGPVERAYGVMRTMAWPIQPLEDNAFCLLEHAARRVTHFHASMTQWKNMFSFEICGDQGVVTVDGLGGSYGKERVTWQRRRPESGPPIEESFEFDDGLGSWQREWRAFLDAVAGRGPAPGSAPIASAADGVAVMEVVDALYGSARSGSPTAPKRVESGAVA
jgi:predicted dehydrogenase